MPYAFYKVIHLLGIMMVFLSMGGIMHHVINGGTKENNVWRKAVAMTHGIGLLLVIVAGFGLLARLGVSVLSGWVIVKLIVWLIIGGLSGVIYKQPTTAKPLWFIILILGAVAAYLAGSKPF